MGDHHPKTNSTTTGGGNGPLKRLRSPPTQKKRSSSTAAAGEVPGWVMHMINIMQYRDCPIHSSTIKENKLDRFCINCLVSFCNQCSSNHPQPGHNYIKIRRYVYCDVINRPDFQKHFDCSGIQGYVTNKNKVLFLKRRGDISTTQQAADVKAEQQQQNTHRGDRSCIICNHSLIDSFYCSIQCKVSAMKSESIKAAAGANNNTTGLVNANAKDEEEAEPPAAAPPPLITPKRKGPRKGIPQRASLF